MRKIFAALALAAALTGCGPSDIINSVGNSPAPLQKTVIDKQSLKTVWRGFDLALTASDALMVLRPAFAGSPSGKAVAKHFRTAQNALNAATAAQKAGSVSDYKTAMLEASAALSLAQAALKGI